MRTATHRASLLLLCILVLTPAVRADYTGLSVALHDTVQINGNPFSVYRVYANFTDPGDRLVYGGSADPQTAPCLIESRNGDDSAPGGDFYNWGGPATHTSPSSAVVAVVPEAQWDTFVTIGVSLSDQSPYGDQTWLTPGFPGIAGNTADLNNAAWFTTPTFDHDNNPATPEIAPPQSVAGWTGDGDDELRVLMIQLTVPQGDNVRGIMSLAYFPPIGGGGGQSVINIPFQSFNSFTIPAPSALSLLALGTLGLLGRRRRVA